MKIRTDLAVEAHEMSCKGAQASSIEGVVAHEETIDGYQVTVVKVLNSAGAQAIGKPIGQYVTVTIEPILHREEHAFARCCAVLSDQLRSLLPTGASAALIAGLGNPKITPDAVGPIAVENIVVTRHLIETIPTYFSSYRPVCAVSPGVLGMTGIESGETIKGIVEQIQPDFVIAIDALASRKLSRVCTTIQFSDTGIVPGSGVGNARNAINQDEIGIPVIAIGVPTVVDATTLAWDLLEESGQPHPDRELLEACGKQMIVTPREIDTRVSDAGKLIGYSINLALHDGMTVEDVDMFLS